MRDVMHRGRLVPTMVRRLIQIDEGECDTTKELASHMKGRIAWRVRHSALSQGSLTPEHDHDDDGIP